MNDLVQSSFLVGSVGMWVGREEIKLNKGSVPPSHMSPPPHPQVANCLSPTMGTHEISYERRATVSGSDLSQDWGQLTETKARAHTPPQRGTIVDT